MSVLSRSRKASRSYKHVFQPRMRTDFHGFVYVAQTFRFDIRAKALSYNISVSEREKWPKRKVLLISVL